MAVKLGNDHPGCRMKVTRPAVVAQPLPQAQYVLLARPRKRMNRRPASHEPPVVRHHRRDLRLLQHRLADKHAVRVAKLSRRRAPRQAAMMLAIPTKHRPPKPGNVLNVNRSG